MRQTLRPCRLARRTLYHWCPSHRLSYQEFQKWWHPPPATYMYPMSSQSVYPWKNSVIYTFPGNVRLNVEFIEKVNPSNRYNCSHAALNLTHRYTFWENRLNDEYMIMFPKQMANEKNTCETAAYHTFGFRSWSNCGVIKYKIPSPAPGSVTERTNKTPMITYGKMARKYDAFPELRIPEICLDKQLCFRKLYSFC